ncbi:PREDICTED: proton-coupled folate transporter-like isoform X1 [Polistes canadensis]|uniref:proton-coupled folate transporter-like isoform X1 n=2 Tax=Polistes canadensis TaxID=91411 RepID=UPI000718BC1E|nr:PREDICTED: proton-coupled folate transporter-like isoform X1 [Polistes canadensis]XP_014612075.1 PREDICTED: proton-coupled folate transporter-like isoform X1 [Polistes canadensis]
MAIVTGWRRYVTVQPPAMMILCAISMIGAIITELVLYRTCTIVLNINKTECLLLKNNGSSSEALRINKLVQPEIYIFNICKSVIESLLPTILSFFVGPWSDTYGRKPLFITSLFGYTLGFAILSLMSKWQINPWYFLIAYIPIACFGGLCFVLLASLSYITDITSEEDRTWHITCFDIYLLFGLVAGIYTGPLMCKYFGYAFVFGIAAVFSLLANLFILFLVPETIQRSSSMNLSSLFDKKHVVNLFNACKSRIGFDRCLVWCCSIYLLLLITTVEGDMTIIYLFTNARLGWNAIQYSYYMVTNIILGGIGSLIGYKILCSLLGFSEVSVVIFATFSSLCGAFIKSFTWLPWHMYLAIAVSMFGGLCGSLIRSVVSKSVPSTDIGKIFSLITSIQMITPIFACTLYSTIYTEFLPPIYPSPVWLISCTFFTLMIVLSIVIKIRISSTCGQQYIEISQESE